MNNNKFSIKRGDTSPGLLYALTPTTVNLTGANVVFNMKDRRTGEIVLYQAVAEVVTEIDTPEVAYRWQQGDTDHLGDFLAEFEVTYADGNVETFPNSHSNELEPFIVITFTPDIRTPVLT